MGSSCGLEALPQELQVHCVEFLSLAEAASVAKQLSIGTRAAARRALTRGRWRPVCEVAQNGHAIIRAVMGNACVPPVCVPPRARTWQERLAGLSDASLALFREAWALEPAEVFIIITLWMIDVASLFLCLVEPSIDDLRRFIAASEPWWRRSAGNIVMGYVRVKVIGEHARAVNANNANINVTIAAPPPGGWPPAPRRRRARDNEDDHPPAATILSLAAMFGVAAAAAILLN